MRSVKPRIPSGIDHAIVIRINPVEHALAHLGTVALGVAAQAARHVIAQGCHAVAQLVFA